LLVIVISLFNTTPSPPRPSPVSMYKACIKSWSMKVLYLKDNYDIWLKITVPDVAYLKRIKPVQTDSLYILENVLLSHFLSVFLNDIYLLKWLFYEFAFGPGTCPARFLLRLHLKTTWSFIFWWAWLMQTSTQYEPT
jgi:hypothetical protein